MFNQAHMRPDDRLLRGILAKMHHDGCVGRPGKAELITGIEAAGGRPPVRRILLREG
jgi:hypothetical protein